MNTPATRKGKIRPATAADFEAVYPLLRQLNDTRISRDIWRRLFEPLWRPQPFCPGYLIDDEGHIGGFIGALYVEREVAGESRVFCNLTSWIVEPAYRAQSVMLLLPLLRDKRFIITSFTSNDESYQVYNKLKFKDLEVEARVIYRFPHWRSGAYRLHWDDALEALLDARELGHFRHHQFAGLRHCLIQHESHSCYLVIELKRGRGHIHYASAPGWLAEHLAACRWPLMGVLGVRTLQLDERFLGGVGLWPSRRKTLSHPRQYRGALAPGDIDALYSELLVLASPGAPRRS